MSTPIDSKAYETFVPRKNISRSVGREVASVYPQVEPHWSNHERAHAYHTSRAGLRLLNLDPNLYLDTLADLMNCSMIVDGEKHDFIQLFKSGGWLDWRYLTIMSFHNDAGFVMNNATTAGDVNVLKPVADGPIPQCRPANVKYVRVKLSLDYAAMITTQQRSTVLHAEYYIELPQTSRQVLDGLNQPRTLVTFHGVDDLRTLSVQEMLDQIISNVPYDVPITLSDPAFNTTSATVDEIEPTKQINKRILMLGMETIEEKMFAAVCPNMTNKPSAAVENIKQQMRDTEGNEIVCSIGMYYTRFMAAARPFAHAETCPVDLCKLVFIDGFHSNLRSAFEELYPRHSEPHDPRGRYQRTQLQVKRFFVLPPLPRVRYALFRILLDLKLGKPLPLVHIPAKLSVP